jgi:hypothetical protein
MVKRAAKKSKGANILGRREYLRRRSCWQKSKRRELITSCGFAWRSWCPPWVHIFFESFHESTCRHALASSADNSQHQRRIGGVPGGRRGRLRRVLGKPGIRRRCRARMGATCAPRRRLAARSLLCVCHRARESVNAGVQARGLRRPPPPSSVRRRHCSRRMRRSRYVSRARVPRRRRRAQPEGRRRLHPIPRDLLRVSTKERNSLLDESNYLNFDQH